MAKVRNRTYSRYALQAMQVFAGLIKTARKKHRWTEAELAERAGISHLTVRKIEQGNPGTELGLYFEVATLLGIPLFAPDGDKLTAIAHQLDLHLALLPKRIDKQSAEVFDEF